jgi:hypothetical protein
MKIVRENINETKILKLEEMNQFIKLNRGLIFHEVEFNKIVSEVFNTKLSYLIALNSGDQIIGICPLHTIEKRLLKLTYSNPTIFEIPYGGWIFDGRLLAINQLLKQTKLSYNESLIYWSNIQIKEDIYKGNIVGAHHRQTAVIDLSLTEEDTWKAIIHSKRRNMIRKALKSAIKIKFYGSEGFDLYYPLMKETQKKIGEKTKPKKFYKIVLETYFKKKQTIILLAERNGEFISGIILIGNKYVMHYWQGASKMNVPNLGQGELLQWEAIKWSKQNGCNYYDLCVIEKERLPHIAKFKLGFSKKLVSFYYISKRPITFKVLNVLSRLGKWF